MPRGVYPRTAAHMEPLRAAHLGHPLTPAHRAKLSAAASVVMRQRWAEADTPLRNPTVIGECVYCGGPATQRDHVIPRSLAHPGVLCSVACDDNQVLACARCNNSKNQSTPDEWLARGLYAS